MIITTMMMGLMEVVIMTVVRMIMNAKGTMQLLSVVIIIQYS